MSKQGSSKRVTRDSPLRDRIERFAEKLPKKHVFESAEYKPHPAQQQIHGCGARFIAAICGRRFGKSMLAAYEAAYRAGIPGGRVWIVAPYRELSSRVWNLAKDILVLALGHQTVYDRSAELFVRFQNGSELVGKTAENPDSLLGEGLDYAVMDEAARIKPGVFHRYILPALADKRGRALLIGTPGGRGWLRELAESGGSPEWKIFKFPSSKNPHLESAELRLQRKLLSETDYRREFLADWTADDSLVYPMFDVRRHTHGAEYDPGLPLFAGCDFGYTSPGCALFAQVTPSETLIVLDEIYERGMTAGEWAQAIIARAKQITCWKPQAAPCVYSKRREMRYAGLAGGLGGFEGASARLDMGIASEKVAGSLTGLIATAFCDPAGAGERAVFERWGIPTIGPRAGVEAGIVRVRALLEPAGGGLSEYGDSQSEFPGGSAGGARISISRKCVNLIKEFGEYSYADGAGEQKVLKTADHALDALRYLVVGLGV